MDTNDLSSLSEVESLSDSDWLDISSRASSLADSDHEDLASDYRPPSRRSLASFDSPREGEIQGWEGIIEDSADEGSPVLSGEDETEGAIDPLRFSHQSLSFRTVALSDAAVARHTALEDPEEEQRVKDGLDQSMISTLSSSRSNSLNASIQTSIVHSRDLRLSFPDPLTSSSPRAQSLSPSYEDVSVPTDTDITLSERDTRVFTDMPVIDSEAALTALDPGSEPTPEVARKELGERSEISSSDIVDFNVVLYGASSAAKHRVVHRLLEKLIVATQCGFTALPQIEVPRNIRMLLNGGRETHCIISIVDNTQNVLYGKEPSALVLSDRPSLAIIFLPSPSILVPEHTLYLPVLNQDEPEEEDDGFAPVDRLLDAEYQWDTMGLPRSKLISSAFTIGRSTVVEEEEVERASPMKVARALRPLLPWTERWSTYHLASRHTFTLFAILSIVLGYLVNGFVPIPGVRRASPVLDVIPRPVPAPVANASMPAPASSPSSVGLIPSSLKDFALAALSPYSVASTSSVAVKAAPSHTVAPASGADHTSALSECSCGCGLITWPEKFKPTTDLMLRPTPPSPSLGSQAFQKGEALSVVAPSTSVKGKGKARATNEDSFYALSTRIAGALSEYLDMHTIFAQTYRDVEEIIEALDELASAISRQTEVAWAQSKAAVEVVRENIRTRHARARTRAKELKVLGERFLSSVGAQVRDRVSMAKENARVLRESVRIHRENSFRMKRERREGRQERRRERRAERRARRVQRVE